MITISSINFEVEISTFGGVTNFIDERLLPDREFERSEDHSWPVGDRTWLPTGELQKPRYLCLLGDLQRIINFDSEIAHGAFQFRVAQEQLYDPEILRSSVYQRRFRPPEGVRPIRTGIKTDFPNPPADNPRILPRG